MAEPTPPQSPHKAINASALAFALTVVMLIFVAPYLGWEPPGAKDGVWALQTIIEAALAALINAGVIGATVYQTQNYARDGS